MKQDPCAQAPNKVGPPCPLWGFIPMFESRGFLGRAGMIIGISISTLLVWLACHFVGDFAFQSAWMSVEKGKSWEVNFYHAATYTAVFVLFALPRPSVLATAILFGAHVVVDPLKARYKIIGPIWVDQLLHIVTIVLILWLKM